MTIVEVITISIRNRAIYFHDSFFFLFFFFLTRVEIVAYLRRHFLRFDKFITLYYSNGIHAKYRAKYFGKQCVR